MRLKKFTPTLYTNSMKRSSINQSSPKCMSSQSKQRNVFAVRSLEETRRILLANERIEIKPQLKRAFIITWVLVTNCSLYILKFILFKKWGYDRKDFKDIVVYTVGIVGDNVIMLPALAALRRRYQDAKITVVTNCQMWDQQGAKGVLEPSPFSNHLIILNDHPVQREGFSFHMIPKKFEGLQCDLFVNLSPFGNRGWFGAVVREMIFAKKIRAQYAIGFHMSTYSRKGLFNEVQHYFVKNEPRRSEEVLKRLGLSPAYHEDLLPKNNVARESVIKKLDEHNMNNKSLFVINAGAKLEAKCWPSERFAEAAKWVRRKYDAAVVLTGIAAERDISEKIKKELGNSVINLTGETTINELVELLRLAKACITNDTGTMHISDMVGIPTVALFTTRLSPTHWLPAGDKVISLFSLPGCKYCYDDSCQTRECLNAIEVEDVIEALEKVLS